MTTLPPDPLETDSLADYGAKLRRGGITAEAATAAYLARITILDHRLGAFEHVATDSALAAAKAIDRLLAAGTDLGPLMGVPIAIKDIIAVHGMPTTAGSNLDVTDLIGPEGTFIKALKRAGCIILGKVKTSEFARGKGGGGRTRGVPRNPWDAKIHRSSGGSSHGSAVATAAGLCAFAVGSDTGGSVRLPASLCGVFGLKTTAGLWPTDGVFSLSTTLDTLGLLTKSAADAAVVFGTLSKQPIVARSPRGLRFGKPENHFFEGLSPEVERGMGMALETLAKAGVDIVEFAFPEIDERRIFIPALTTAEFIAGFGRDRLRANRAAIDPTVWALTEPGFEYPAEAYIRLARRHQELCRIAQSRMEGFDGWIAPTALAPAPPEADVQNPSGARPYDRIGQNLDVANLFGLCATTTPIPAPGSQLPIGLQLVCPGHGDLDALSMALTFEQLFGLPPRPDLRGFLGAT